MFFLHYLTVLSYVFASIFTIWGLLAGLAMFTVPFETLDRVHKWNSRAYRLATFSILLGIASFVYLVMGIIRLF